MMKTGETIIWTQPGCLRCEIAKTVIGEGNYEERAADLLLSGFEQNLEAMVQLVQQNMELPIISCDGEFIVVDEIIGAQQDQAELALCGNGSCKVK